MKAGEDKRRTWRSGVKASEDAWARAQAAGGSKQSGNGHGTRLEAHSRHHNLATLTTYMDDHNR